MEKMKKLKNNLSHRMKGSKKKKKGEEEEEQVEEMVALKTGEEKRGEEKEDEKRREKKEEEENGLHLRTLPRENHESVPVQHEDWDQAAQQVVQQLLLNRSIVKAEREQQRTLEGWRQQATAYPPSWIKELQQTVQKAARSHFPPLPREGSPEQQLQLPTYLSDVQEVLVGELRRLAPLLREAGLLPAVIDGYHVHTMGQLELLLQRRLNSDQLFTLLRWTLKTYLSEEVLGQRELHGEVMTHLDFMTYTEAVHNTQQHLLNNAQEDLGVCLERILQEAPGVCNDAHTHPVEEVHKHVAEWSETAKEFSPVLLSNLSHRSLQTLHSFVDRYVAMETKRNSPPQQLTLTTDDLTPLYNTIHNCSQLRRLAVQLAADAQTNSDATEAALEKLCKNTTDQLLHTAAHSIEVPLQTYLKPGGSGDLGEVQSTVEQLLVPLPKLTDPGAHKDVVDSVYECVTSSYLRLLLVSNHKQLIKMWGDIGDRVTQDGEELHTIFTAQDRGVEKRVSLLKVCEILKDRDVDGLKLSIAHLITAWPSIREEQVSRLLQWKEHKGDLSSEQRKEVLEAVREYLPRPAVKETPTTTSQIPTTSQISTTPQRSPTPQRNTCLWGCLRSNTME